jgi:nitrogen regulatory protein PII
MIKIEAIIKPFKLEEVQEALHERGIFGMTVTEVQGYGRQKGQTEIYRGAKHEVNFVPKVKLEIVVDEPLSKEVTQIITEAACTNKIGDGKIFIYDLKNVIRIRTGESGPSAI